MARIPGLPGEPDIWSVGGQMHAVYTVPGTDVPLMYRFERDGLYEAAGSPDPDRRMTSRQARAKGAVEFGVTSELDAQLGGHPWDSFLARIERDADIQPWLEDPEVVAHVASAWLRGTTPNLERTEWWQSRTDAERQWIERAASNPTQARQELRDNREAVSQRLVAEGFRGPQELRKQAARLISDRMTKGEWSQEAAISQMRKLSDPFFSAKLDDDLKSMMGGVWHEQGTRENEDRVSELSRMWLGPNHELSGVSEQEWAARLRLWEDGEDRLIQHLQRQRKALYPEYEDETLTYEDIASPWRGFVQQHWGTTPDETDPIFDRVIRNNDSGTNLALLRREGMERGNSQVLQDLASDTMRAFGSGVREAI